MHKLDGINLLLTFRSDAASAHHNFMIELPANFDRDAQLLDLDRADCEESLYTFFRGAWPYIDPAPWVEGWCMEAIAEHLEAVCDGEIRRLLINISPRCSKSNLVSVAFPAWIWAQQRIGPVSGPKVPFLHTSYANQLALRDSVKCRRLIESPWYQQRWGTRFSLTSDQNTKSRFTNDQGGERLITSVDGTNTGEGGMCFIGGTAVATPRGDRPIETLQAGDEVLSFDVTLGKVVISRVVATAKRKTNDLVELREVSGRRAFCTPDHPIYSPGRGFVRADQLGEKGALLVHGAGEIRTAQDHDPLQVRSLRRAGRQVSLRSAQGAEARKSRRLLQQKVLFVASCVQKLSSHMQNLWERAHRAACDLLLGCLQTKDGQLEYQGSAEVPDVRRGIPDARKETKLFEEMRRRRSLQTDEGISELQIQGARDGSVFEPVQSDEGTGQATRRILLHELRRSREDHEVELSAENLFALPPHRRGPKEQSPGESDHLVREVPSASPPWHVAHLASASRHSGREVEVYDIQVEGTSCFFAEGILAHNCIINDDPNSVDDVDSEASIQSTIDWWDGTMVSRLNNQETGAQIVIQQRTFENDISGHILETDAGEWVHLMIPMRYEPERSFQTVIGWKDPRTEPGELMWPERFGEATVKRLETRMGPFRAAGQLQQRPEPAGGGIIKREWWKVWEHDSYPPMDFVLATLDGAYTEDRMNDPSGMIIWGIFSGDVKSPSTMVTAPASGLPGQEGRPYRRDATYSEFAPHVMCMYAWTARLELHELVEKVAETCIKMKVDLLLIENKASGHSVSQEIRRLYWRERFGVELFDPKSQDKAARLYSVQHLFAEGIIYGPDRPWMEGVITQVGSFPKGKHDEYVDLTSMGLRKLRDMGLLIRQPEREAENESAKVYPRGQDMPLYPV